MMDLINPTKEDSKSPYSGLGALYNVMLYSPEPLNEHATKAIIRLLVSKINQLSEISNQQQLEIQELKKHVK